MPVVSSGSRATGARTHFGVYVGNLLDRAAFTRPAVFGGDNAAIGTLAKLLDEEVLGVDDKGGVDSGERVSLHLGLWPGWFGTKEVGVGE